MLLYLENGIDVLEGNERRDRYVMVFGKWICHWLVQLVCDWKFMASEFCACVPLNFGFTQNHRMVGVGPLWITWSNPSAKAGSPRTGCTGPVFSFSCTGTFYGGCFLQL